jgi:hypothetical protein
MTRRQRALDDLLADLDDRVGPVTVGPTQTESLGCAPWLLTSCRFGSG